MCYFCCMNSSFYYQKLQLLSFYTPFQYSPFPNLSTFLYPKSNPYEFFIVLITFQTLKQVLEVLKQISYGNILIFYLPLIYTLFNSMQYILSYYNLSQMLQNSPSTNLVTQTLPFQSKMTTGRSFLLQDIDIPLPQQNAKIFKFHPTLIKASQHVVFKEITRFFIYSLILLLLFSYFGKSPNSMIYSFISRDPSDNMISLTKQIPGLFPPLNSNWLSLLTKWNITLLNGKQGSQNLKSQNYQLQFKHFVGQQRQDVVYITKGNCKGHIIMNWQVHGSNIYLTSFQPPKEDSMLILNEPEDELCIKQNALLFQLFNKASIWTITEQNQKISLFLLMQQTDSNNQHDNYVLISQKSKE